MKRFVLAIETGATKLQAFLGTPEGEIVHRQRDYVIREDGAQGIVKTVERFAETAKAEAAKIGGEIVRMGVGFGGPVEVATGRVLGSMQIANWTNFPLGPYLTEKTGIETRVYNDTDAATWGEYRLGCGKGSKVFVYTNIGSGIGGGVVLNNKVYTGQGIGAAEFGHMLVPDCGGIIRANGGDLESMCSGMALERLLVSTQIPADSLIWTLCGGVQSAVTTRMMAAAAEQGDAFANQLLDEVAEIFSRGLANVLCLFSPEIIAIGGGLSMIGEPLIGRIRKYTDKYAYMNNKGTYKILRCELDEDAVPLGTLLLAGGEE